MNTSRVRHFPVSAVVIVGAVLVGMSSFVILIFVAWSLVHVRSSEPPIQVDPLQIVDTFHNVVNRGDVDALLALFTNDATIDDSGSIFSGRDELRAWILHSPRMTGLHLKMLQAQILSDRIIWTDVASNASENELGVYILQWVAVIQNNKIRSLMVSSLPVPDGK